MKIEIRSNDLSGARGYEVYDLTHSRYVKGKSAMFPRDFDDNDILELLGDKGFAKFEAGQYQFTVTNKQVYIATRDFSYYSPSFANDHQVLKAIAGI